MMLFLIDDTPMEKIEKKKFPDITTEKASGFDSIDIRFFSFYYKDLPLSV